LPAHEREITAELEEERLELGDEGALEVGLGVLVAKVEELEDVRLFDLLLGGHDVIRSRQLPLAEHRRLVPRQRRAFVELTVDLAIELPDGPATAKGLRFVEATAFEAPHRQEPHVVRPRELEAGCNDRDGSSLER
jgi:hypothetical protein